MMAAHECAGEAVLMIYRCACGHVWATEPVWPTEPPLLADDPRHRDIALLGLSTRAYNALRVQAGLRTIGEVIQQSPRGLAKLKNLGRGTLRKIVSALAEHGLALQPDYVEFRLTPSPGELAQAQRRKERVG